jgi:PAS domain S-box-containing protein
MQNSNELDYRALVENLNEVVYMLDTEARVQYISPNVERLGGYLQEEVIGKSFIDFVHPEDKFDRINEFKKALAGKADATEYRFVKKNGDTVWVLTRARATMKDGSFLGVQGTLADISQIKELENQLFNAQKQVEYVFENNQIPSFVLEVIGEDTFRYARTNRAFQDTVGLSKAQIKGKSPQELFGVDIGNRIVSRLALCVSSRKTVAYEGEHESSSGDTIWHVQVDPVMSEDERVVSIWGTCEDITERKQAENALIKSEQKYKELVDNINDVVWRTDENLKLTFLSSSVNAIIGESAESFIKRPVKKRYTPESVVKLRSLLTDIVEQEKDPKNNRHTSATIDVDAYHVDGSIIKGSMNISVLRDEHGKLCGFQGVGRDVTELRKTEKALVRAAQEWRITFDSLSEMIVILDEVGKILRVNGAFAKVVKKEPRELIGLKCSSIFKGIKKLPMVCMESVGKAGGTSSTGEIYEQELGKYLEYSMSPLLNEGNQYMGMVCVFRDVTERKRRQKKIVELYRKEKQSRRELQKEIDKRFVYTGMVTHEMKNYLASLAASAEFMASMELGEVASTLVNNVQQSTIDLQQLALDMQDMAMLEDNALTVECQPVNPVKIIRDMSEAIKPLASTRRQSINLKIPQKLPMVMADESRTRQVLLNLLDNASKYTPGDGSISIEAQVQGDYLVVNVKNTGKGIEPNDVPFIFDMYYSHKSEEGHATGTGFGLPLSKALVEKQGGKIWVENVPGEYVNFFFTIPLITPQIICPGMDKKETGEE